MVTENVSRSFERLGYGVGVGHPAPSGWQHIADCRLVIIVGVTGVGKSTMLSQLDRTGRRFTLLPDRRSLTDRLIIAEMQLADGVPVTQVRDRKRTIRSDAAVSRSVSRRNGTGAGDTVDRPECDGANARI